jgi:exonuclease VII small subunit
MTKKEAGKNKKSLSEALSEINSIIDWFESQTEVDVEEGLKKIKNGAGLIQESKSRLKEIENEFEVVRKELERD